MGCIALLPVNTVEVDEADQKASFNGLHRPTSCKLLELDREAQGVSMGCIALLPVNLWAFYHRQKPFQWAASPYFL